MLVGIMSDSHDNLPAIEQAVAFFNEKKIGFAVHAGDFVAPFTLKPLEKLECPWIGVYGNNDGEQAGLMKLSKGRIQPAPYELNLDAHRVVVVHDLNNYSIEDFESKGTEILIHGHTHAPEVKKENDIIFINPGELGGWVSGKKTVVLLDTKTLESSIEVL